MDEIRQHAWVAVGVLAALGVAVAAAAVRRELAAGTAANILLPAPVELPPWVIDRAQSKQAEVAVCGKPRAVGIATSLEGAGGFGKTTLAMMACASPRVRRHFGNRIFVVTIGRDVRGPAAVAAKVAEATRFITGDTMTFDDPQVAGQHLGRLLTQLPRTLLVLDDVWESDQLDPFLVGGDQCTRLVTTRKLSVLPSGTEPINVDAMSTEQARHVLTWQLPPLPESTVEGLLNTTGRWPLLLRLTNRLISTQVATGADPAAAALEALHELRTGGPSALDDSTAIADFDDPKRRSLAVRASVDAATTLLSTGGRERFAELSVFAEDESIPIPLIIGLWAATGGLTPTGSRLLCQELANLSLVSLSKENGGTITLHDVLRDYLRGELLSADLVRLHGVLTDTVAAVLPPAQPLADSASAPVTAWWDTEHGYILDHLIEHLLAAGHEAEADAVATDLRWVEARLRQRSFNALFADLSLVPTGRSVAYDLTMNIQLLAPTSPPHALTNVLHSRIDHLAHWHDQVSSRQGDLSLRPLLRNQWPLPDRSLTVPFHTSAGHGAQVGSMAIAPDGAWFVTVDTGGTGRIRNTVSGDDTAVAPRRDSPVNAVAIAPDGTWLATANENKGAQIWDPNFERCLFDLLGHTGPVTRLTISPDGTWLATASHELPPAWINRPSPSTDSRDTTVRIWDRASGACTTVFTGHSEPVKTIVISPDGQWIASAGEDATVRIWNPASGTCRAILTGETASCLVIAPDGTWLATAGEGNEARIWDPVSGTCTAALTGHERQVTALSIAPDGTWLATASGDTTIRLWGPRSGTCIATLTGHSEWIKAVAISPDGAWMASTGNDGTLRIWDLTTNQTATLVRTEGALTSCIWTPDGRRILVGGERGLYGYKFLP